MKKYAFVLLAGSIIGLSACGSDSNDNTQEQIDSAVNAKAAELEAAQNAKNDSILNEMARLRADSAAMAEAANKPAASASRPSTPRTTKPSKPATAPTGTKVTDRPGATDAQVNGQRETPKSVSDRPGATNVNR